MDDAARRGHRARDYDPSRVAAYFAAATQAALVLAALRAPYRGRSTPVNAWWGSFDLAVGLFSGEQVSPPSQDFIVRNSGDAQQIEVGWWPGDHRYPGAAFYAYAYPPPEGFAGGALTGERALGRDARRVHPRLGRCPGRPTPTRPRSSFARSAVEHGCRVCGWNPGLAASMEGDPPPVR